MIIYNVTMKVDWEIAEDWLQWMQDIYIPEIVGTGCFEKHQLVKLLEVDDAEGPTYAAQYYANNVATYNKYVEQYSGDLRKGLSNKWGDKCLAFGTLMQVVE
jgi:hypothetical protein